MMDNAQESEGCGLCESKAGIQTADAAPAMASSAPPMGSSAEETSSAAVVGGLGLPSHLSMAYAAGRDDSDALLARQLLTEHSPTLTAERAGVRALTIGDMTGT